MQQDMEAKIQEVAQLVGSANYVVALVGAGLSAESGVPTYRGPDGVWTRLGHPNPLSFKTFLDDPAYWWRHHMYPTEGPRAEMRRALEKARPNPGHYALAQLEAMGVIKHIITQNVDGLHQRAGSIKVAEIHGNRYRLRCLECAVRYPLEEFPVVELPPRCPDCGGIIKGDTVMFGEQIPRDVLEVCFQEAERCDCMLLLGTSATVYPAASFPEMVRQKGGSLIEVNTEDTPLSDRCNVVLRGASGETLPALVDRVRELVKARVPGE